MTIAELAKKLIDIPSLTGEEQAIGEFLAGYLDAQGFSVKKQEIISAKPETSDVASKKAVGFNLIAALGDPKILFNTHLDTVPPYIPFREDDEYIYGRGACDAKGIIAAMLKAGQKLMQENRRDFGYLFTVGEEADSVGAKAAAELNLKSDYLIVGEPTENKLALGHKGNLTFSLTTHGKAAHSAYPEQGESAIEKLLETISDLKRENFGTDAVLGRTTINIGVIEGGTGTNVIPDRALAKIMLRIVASADSVEEKVRSIIKDRAEVEIISKVDPQRMTHVTGFPTTVVSFGTDIHYLKEIGKPLLIGPGSILDAHTITEKISKRELNDAIEMYYHLAKHLAQASQLESNV